MTKYIKREYILLLCIIVVGAIIRFTLLPMTFWYGDTARDLLVPMHMLQYQEFPNLGHVASGTTPVTYYPPLYFYILAFIMIPSTNFWYITCVMILMNTLSIGVIYFLTKRLSDSTSAFITTLLYTFSSFMISNQISITAYRFSLPLFLMGTYLHVRGIQKKHLSSICAGFFFLALSASMNYAVLILIPVYIAWTVFYFWEKPKTILYTICFVYGVFVCLFYGYAKYVITQIGLYGFAAPYLPMNNVTHVELIPAMLDQYQMYIGNIFPGLPPIMIACITVLIALHALFNHRKIFSLLYPLSFILITIILSSIRAKSMSNYYYYPISPFLFMILGISYSNLKPHFIKIFSGVALLLFGWFAISQSAHLYSLDHTYAKTEQATNIMADALLRIQKTDGYPDMHFFRLHTINAENHAWQMSAYAYFLEKKLGKLLIVDDHYHNLKWMGNEDYLVIVCIQDSLDAMRWCQNWVSKTYPHAIFIEDLPNPLSSQVLLYKNK